jgi:hypothetical protein
MATNYIKYNNYKNEFYYKLIHLIIKLKKKKIAVQ